MAGSSQPVNRPSPRSWNDYERGRASSSGSLQSVPEELSTPTLSASAPRELSDTPRNGLQRRRSSATARFNALRQMGGPNSMDNFTRSWQRAASFREITARRRNSVSMSHGESGGEDSVDGISPAPRSRVRSLLKQQLQAAGGHGLNESAVHDAHEEVIEPAETTLLLNPSSKSPLLGSLRQRASLEPSNLGQSYGSISSRLTPEAQRRASILLDQQHEANLCTAEDEDDNEFLDDMAGQNIEHEVLPSGEVIERICGQSTVPQTIFNSVNVLVGVGILALPLAVRLSGWVLGMIFLILAAAATNYTAKLLARCLDTNSGATTYGDIAYLAFGSVGRNVTEVLFILELTGANVAFVILFGDTMNVLIPGVSILTWKVVLAIGLMPLNFAPFRYLSITSILGIICCAGLVVILVIDGLYKPDTPGSLRSVAATYAFPQDWHSVPLSLGLFMAPWGGHSVFPAVYKDMRHPQKYSRALVYTYAFTYGVDLAMAVIGYLMFGDSVGDEVTTNLLKSTAYPHALNVLVVVLIAIVPITKIPLTNRPMTDTINKKLRIDLRQMDPKARAYSERSRKHRLARGTIACLGNVLQLGLAVLVPGFDSIMGLMGSALCFTICVIFPVAFYLKIFSKASNEIGRLERMLDYGLIVVCTALAVMGSVFALLPSDYGRM